MAQYHEIASLPGVSVAAPIAMVGYALMGASVAFTIPAADYRGPGRQLYRYQTTWVSDHGTSRVTEPPSFTYVTPGQLQSNPVTGGTDELVPGHGAVTACPNSDGSPTASPFGAANQSFTECWSKVDGLPLGPGDNVDLAAPGWYADWVIPVLIAA